MTPMWLVLCDENDSAAYWAFDGLRKRSLLPIELITSREVASKLRVTYRASTHSTSVVLQDASGRQIDWTRVRGGLNRLHGPYLGAIRQFAEEDQSYVHQELFSGILGWLSALTPNLINRPTPLGLAGRYRSTAEWIWLAGRSGLPAMTYRETTTAGPSTSEVTPVQATKGTTAFVVGGQCLATSDLPGCVVEGCLRLSDLAETRLLGVDFSQDETGSWWFAGASPVPNLELGGDALLDRLAVVLAEEFR